MVSSSNLTVAPQRGIPGKLFVIPFVFALIVLCFLMIAVAIRFQSIMARLEESRSLWPDASQELGERYELINASFLNTLKGEAKDVDWEESKRQFSVSTQFDRQSTASMVIEKQITRTLDESNSSDAPKFVASLKSPGISKLIDAERRRGESQGDFIGWLTVNVLRLKLPGIFTPEAQNK